jgi:hypothetical protein
LVTAVPVVAVAAIVTVIAVVAAATAVIEAGTVASAASGGAVVATIAVLGIVVSPITLGISTVVSLAFGVPGCLSGLSRAISGYVTADVTTVPAGWATLLTLRGVVITPTLHTPLLPFSLFLLSLPRCPCVGRCGAGANHGCCPPSILLIPQLHQLVDLGVLLLLLPISSLLLLQLRNLLVDVVSP